MLLCTICKHEHRWGPQFKRASLGQWLRLLHPYSDAGQWYDVLGCFGWVFRCYFGPWVGVCSIQEGPRRFTSLGFKFYFFGVFLNYRDLQHHEDNLEFRLHNGLAVYFWPTAWSMYFERGAHFWRHKLELGWQERVDRRWERQVA